MQATDGIRAAVDTVGRDLSQLGERATASEVAALRASWVALVEVLALGPAPEYRECPHCGSTGMRAATRCSQCWKVLVPPPSPGAGSDVGPA
jgi:hypothetical protein